MNREVSDDTLCLPSPTGYHYHNLDYVLGAYQQARSVCDYCNHRITVQGHRWVSVYFLIEEEEHIEDLIG